MGNSQIHTNPTGGKIMGTYGDKLRELARLLDENFDGNLQIVIFELLIIIKELFPQLWKPPTSSRKEK